jgi:hypothetical protein
VSSPAVPNEFEGASTLANIINIARPWNQISASGPRMPRIRLWGVDRTSINGVEIDVNDPKPPSVVLRSVGILCVTGLFNHLVYTAKL